MPSYNDFLKKQEFSSWEKKLEEINFSKKLEYLAKKYKNKEILIYGNGVLFEAICKNYDLEKFLNIVNVSDIRYEKENIDYFLNFKTIKPSLIKKSSAKVILITTINPKEIKKFLLKNNFVAKNVIIEPFLQDSFNDKLNKIQKKCVSFQEYFALSGNIFKSAKYFFNLDEIEFQSKINYLKVINKLKLEKRKIKIAFLCEENAKWGYQSVYEEFKKDENFEVLPIINLPILTYSRQELTQNKNKEFFDSFNMESINGFNQEKGEYKAIEEMQPDIIFYQQPWYIIESQLPQKTSEFALNVIVSYGLTSISVDSWGSQNIREKMGNMWKMFCESKYHEKFYKKAAQLKNKDIAQTIGYPKLDFYSKEIDEHFEKLWKDENRTRPRIIWAPHYSIDKYGLSMSNFKEQYQFFLDFAKKHTEYRFIFKPHPMLKHQCIKEKFMNEEEFEKYIDEWNCLENATCYNKGNYFDIFKSSDVLITDCSSFLAEYFYSGKPIIFFDNKTRAKFNSFGKKLKKYFYIPKKLDDLERLLYKLLISKEDSNFSKRQKIIQNKYYYPDLGIGKRIVEYIKKELGVV